MIAAAILLAAAASGQLPATVRTALPPHRAILAHATMAAPMRGRTFFIVAMATGPESTRGPTPAPVRPLVILARDQNGRVSMFGRNDDAVLRADEGGQCDPFLDGGGTITVRGTFFTVENGVACGQHWTDLVTFRLDATSGRFVFDNERRASWSLNPSEAPDAPAMIRDGPQTVTRANRHRPVPFAAWRRH